MMLVSPSHICSTSITASIDMIKHGQKVVRSGENLTHSQAVCNHYFCPDVITKFASINMTKADRH